MEAKKKVPLLNKIAYGVGTGGGCVFNQIAAAFLLQYYTDTALISAGAIATMFLVCRVFDFVSWLVSPLCFFDHTMFTMVLEDVVWIAGTIILCF